ncbi:unnamed protein product, partial [Owenia fusiformis]
YEHILPTVRHTILNNDNGGPVVVNDFMKERNLARAYELVSESVEKEHIGEDEIPSYKYFEEHIRKDSTIPFALLEADSETLLGFWTITPSLYCRGVNPINCEGNAIFNDKIKHLGVFPTLSRLFYTYATALGYEGALVGIPQGRHSLLETLQKEGMDEIGTLPKMTRLKYKGWVDGVLLYNRFNDSGLGRDTFRQPKTVVQTPTEVDMKINQHHKKVQDLPRACIMRDGTEVLIDYARDDQIVDIYQIFKDEIDEGNGYAVDEYPTLDHFLSKVGNVGHVFALTLNTGELVGSQCVIPGRFGRTTKPCLAGFPIVLDKRFRGKGNFIQFMMMHGLFCYELGFAGSIGDTFVGNTSVLMKAGGLDGTTSNTITATIPYTAFVNGKGWQDSSLMYADIEGLI